MVKRVCEIETGSRTKNFITSYILRGLLAAILFEAVHSDSSVMMGTDHCDHRSLKHCQNLRSVEGVQQQHDLMGSPSVCLSGHSDSNCASGEPFTISDSTSNPAGAKQAAPVLEILHPLPSTLLIRFFDMSAVHGSPSTVSGVTNTDKWTLNVTVNYFCNPSS